MHLLTIVAAEFMCDKLSEMSDNPSQLIPQVPATLNMGGNRNVDCCFFGLIHLEFYFEASRRLRNDRLSTLLVYLAGKRNISLNFS